MDAVEVECVEALNRLSEAGQTDGNPSFFQSSCPGGQMFTSSKSRGKTSYSTSNTTKSGGAFTCFVPGCFNKKRNPELSFYNFLDGKKPGIKGISKEVDTSDFPKGYSPTTGHRVCSEHFPGGKKNYKNCLPTIVPKTIKPTPTNPRPTTKARNRTVANPSEVPAQQGRCRLFSEVEQDTFDVQNIEPEETLQSGTEENTNLSILLREQIAELTKENKRLKSENERQRTQINKLKEKLKIKWIKSRNILLVNFTILTRKKTKIQIFVGKSQKQNKSFKKRLRHF